jgi:large subunit ribosomal protein LP0
LAAIREIAAVSLAVGYPTIASVPHSVINGYKNLLAVSVASDYTFEGSEQIKEYLANPEAFAVAAAPAAAASSDAPAAAAAEEDEESEDDDMGFGLFD